MDFPRALSSYPPTDGMTLLQVLAQRIEIEPFNAIATAIFTLAILHTFGASRITRYAHRRPPGVFSEILHFFGEVEVVFGLWAVVLLVAMIGCARAGARPRTTSTTRVNYTEPLFVVVIMALASTRPVVALAERVLRRVASLGGGDARGVVAGDSDHRPAARVVHHRAGGDDHLRAAARPPVLRRRPSRRLKYATLGLLFVNVSIGGTLTHFAAPPVLMVARAWDWDTAVHARALRLARGPRDPDFDAGLLARSSAASCVRWRAARAADATAGRRAPSAGLLPVPAWVTVVHVALHGLDRVHRALSAPLFIGGFLFFLGFAKATAPYQASSSCADAAARRVSSLAVS